jgi:hypothetical protein
MARRCGRRYLRWMNWEQQAKSEMFYALIYVGIGGLLIAIAVWSFFTGERLGAALLGALALPWAWFVAMRLNNMRLIRTIIGKRGDTQAT